MRGNTDRNRAIARARVLLDRDPVVIDTETTGVGPVAEVCEIAIVGRTGETVVDTLVRQAAPYRLRPPGYTGSRTPPLRVPGASTGWSPTIFPVCCRRRRAIAIYNAEYDLRLLDQSSGDGRGSAWRDRANTHWHHGAVRHVPR